MPEGSVPYRGGNNAEKQKQRNRQQIGVGRAYIYKCRDVVAIEESGSKPFIIALN